MITLRTIFTVINMEFLQYRRGALIWIAFTLLPIYLVIGYYQFLHEHMQVGQFLESSGYIVMASALFGLLTGILVARREQDSDFAEILTAVPGDSLRSLSKLLAWFIICTFLMLLASLEIIILVWISGSEYLVFGHKLILYVFIYWGLTLFSCGILGYAIGNSLGNSWLKLPLVLITWFFISPFNIVFVKYIPPSILSWLNQGERVISKTYSGIEGLYLAHPLIAKKISFFTICITLAIISDLYRKNRSKSKNEKNILVSLLSFSIIVILLCLSTTKSPLDTNSPPLNNYTNLYLTKDAEYYSNNSNLLLNDPMKSSFNIDNYDIKLVHESNLIEYIAAIEISDVKSNRLSFTLYHGLDIIDLKVDEQTTIWERDGDWLHVNWPTGKPNGVLSMKVKGSTGAYNQISETSFFLSSDFPWYPIPGISIIAERFDLYYEPQYNKINLSTPVNFKVSVKSNNPIFSNLQKVNNNEFEGNTQGVTLLSGMLIERFVGPYHIIGPPDRIEELISPIDKISKGIINLSAFLKTQNPIMPNKIFVVPSFSYSPNYYLRYEENQLFINELMTRNNNEINSLTRLDSIFQAFFWSNEYQLNDEQNSYIFRMLLEYLESSSKEHTVLALQAKEVKRLGERAHPTAYIAQDLLELYKKEGDTGIIKLIQSAYQKSDNENFDIEDWKNLISFSGGTNEYINN